MEKEKRSIHSLGRILKLEKFKIEEVKISIANNYRLIRNLQQSISKLNQSIKKEKNIMMSNPTLDFSFSEFLKRINSQKETLNKEIHILYEERNILLEKIKKLYSLAHGYEKIIEKKQKKLQKHEDAREQKKLDEISINKNNISRIRNIRSHNKH